MATVNNGVLTNISLNTLHTEAGGVSGTQCSLNDTDIRTYVDSPNYYYAGGYLTATSTSTIFNTWDRFSHSGGAFDGVYPANSSELNAWAISSGGVGIESTNNSGSFIGFVCPASQSSTTVYIKADVTSANSDNDLFGIVIAYFKDTAGTYGTTNREYTLSAIRSQNTISGSVAWGLIYNYLQDDSQVIAQGSSIAYQNSGAGWNSFTPSGASIEVTRVGSSITALSTDAGGTTLKDTISYTLGSDSVTTKFNNVANSRYGLCAYSQANCKFGDLIIGPTSAVSSAPMGINATTNTFTSIERYKGGEYT